MAARIAALCAALVVLGMLAGAAEARGGPDTLSLASVSMGVGEARPLELKATQGKELGVGAWTVDVTYNSDVVEVMECMGVEGGPGLSICLPDFAPETLRVTGATSVGLPPEATLAVLGFRCLKEGSSALTITVDVWNDVTIAIPQPPRPIDIHNGSITCVEPSVSTPGATVPLPILPETGAGPSSGGGAIAWPAAALAALGALLAGAWALRREHA